MTPERWRQVTGIFDSALAREAHERAAFLDEACAGDPELLAEVTSLLATHLQPGSFIDAPAYEFAAELIVREPARSMAGEQLGAYRILDKIGTGGMGEVYLAEDTRLGRRVALKLLPAQFTADPNRLRRFEREARATSALNHPNIITLYEIGEASGVHFMATEFVAGQTLRQRLAAEKLELSAVLDVAAQVASALSAAHAAGVVHRDVKLENVMVRPDGLVKVLDFGLAKLAGGRAPAGTPTVPASAWTNPGVVMGTCNCMSPEQARGQVVDARTDIFSLGVMIYEMISGQAPFTGETPSDVIAAILTSEPPPLAHSAPGVPAEMQWIVAKALRKDREERYQSSKELLADLQSLKQEREFKAKLEGSSPSEARDRSGARTGGGAAAETGRRPAASHDTRGTSDPISGAGPLAGTIKRRRLGLVLALAILLVAGAVIAFGLYRFGGEHRLESSAATARITPFTTFPGREDHPAFAPDGKQIAFTWDGGSGNNVDIYVKLIGAGTPLRLTSDPAVDGQPAWSPDGRYIAFIRRAEDERGNNEILLVPALGGVERHLGRLIRGTAGPAWSPDGRTLAIVDRVAPETSNSIYLLSAETLERRKLTSPPARYHHNQPAFSPDGRWLAFVETGNVEVGDIHIAPAGGGEPRRLTSDHRLIEGLAWSADSRDIIFSSNRGGSVSLWRVSISGGTPEGVAVAGKNVYHPAISRQGNLLAYNETFLDSNIWRIEWPGRDAAGLRNPPARLISSTREDHSPQFSPDGRRIAFASDRSGSTEIWVCESDGANPLQLTFFDGPVAGTPRWSPDGREIVFDSRPGGNADIFVVSAAGGKPRPLTADPSSDTVPSWSHDGLWVYFRSSRSGAFQIWKVPAGGGAPVQVTKQGGFEAFESPDGRVLYYTKGRGPGGIWQVPVQGGEETPVLELKHAGYWRYWALLNDGIYFVAREADSSPRLKFFSFATRQVTPMATLEKEPLSDPTGLSVSPDQRSILYVQADQSVSDIILVENFR